MPVDISHYRKLADQSGSIETAGKTVHLSKSGQLVLGGNKFFGRVVSWFKGFRTRQHIATRNDFIEALNTHYGKFITSQVTTQGWVHQHSKKPLTTREVFMAFRKIDDLALENKEKNEQLASRYDGVGIEDYQTESDSTNYLKSQLSNTLREMFPNSPSGEDAEELETYMDIADVGRKIKSKIMEKGDNGKFRVTKKEADNIAKQVSQDEAVKTYKHIMANQHFIFRENSSSLSQRTVDYLNGRIEADLMAEMYKAGDENPKFPSRERVAEIAQSTQDELSKFIDAEKIARSLNIPDGELRTEVITFLAKSELSLSQIKTAWETGVQMQPHFKTIADANSTEEQLEKAINEYTNAVSELQSKDDIEDISSELRTQRSTLMMMAQGGDWRATMGKIHQQITAPGALNSYIRALNHYRLSFPESDAYKRQEAEQPDFYRPGLRRADTFSTWMESLGFASAAMLGKSGGEAEIVARSAPLESSSEVGDRTLNLMRNTGIKMPTPDRIGQSGSGTFCDAAIKYVEDQLSDGKTGPLEENDISEQCLLDIGVRIPAYFNGVPASSEKAEVVEQLKEFCATDGKLNKDMLFAISQFHQGSIGAVFKVFQREQIAPVHGQFIASLDDSKTTFYFNKNKDGSVSVRITFERNKPLFFVSQYDTLSHKAQVRQINLDRDASGLGLDMEFLLTPEQFSADRDKFPPPKVTNLTYRYSLYENKE